MENKNVSSGSSVNAYFAAIVIPATILISICLYMFVLGAPSNFVGNNPDNHPLQGNYLGLIHKGGVIVPVLMSFFLMVLVFSIERFLTINAAYGKGSLDWFVRNVKSDLAANNIDGAMKGCSVQKGSVGNVVYSVLRKYKQMVSEPGMTKEQKIVSIQKEVEEATSLELPMLEKNLTIIATMASICTLVGLLGTVIGMIKAFSALAQAGAPDAAALANGISEALMNTALGISGSALAIIAYNYFTSKIDTLTYSIDEAGFSIVQNFSTNYQEKSSSSAHSQLV